MGLGNLRRPRQPQRLLVRMALAVVVCSGCLGPSVPTQSQSPSSSSAAIVEASQSVPLPATPSLSSSGVTPTLTPTSTPTASAPSPQSWTQLTVSGDINAVPGQSAIVAATATGAGYLAVGTQDVGPMAWTSSDGGAWTRTTSPPAPQGGLAVTMSDVVAGGPGFVAVGSEFGADPCSRGSAPIELAATGTAYVLAIAWTSTDGQSWTRTPASASLAGAAMFRVARVGSRFVAIGVATRGCVTRAAAWTSTDGVHWQLHTPGAWTKGGGGDLVVAGSRLIAVGQSGCPACVARAWTSIDGITWYPATGIGLGYGIYSVASGAHGLVAVGSDRSGTGLIWTSKDGLTWRRSATAGMSGAAVVAAVGTGYVAAGDDGIWDSPDGRLWRHRLTVSTVQFSAIVPSASGILVIGLEGEDPTSRQTVVWAGPAEVGP
jgi:hypothetical protein